ncbi:hypothetical protein RQN30_08300 [Arcanobacterium hippocoleae]
MAAKSLRPYVTAGEMHGFGSRRLSRRSGKSVTCRNSSAFDGGNSSRSFRHQLRNENVFLPPVIQGESSVYMGKQVYY